MNHQWTRYSQAEGCVLVRPRDLKPALVWRRVLNPATQSHGIWNGSLQPDNIRGSLRDPGFGLGPPLLSRNWLWLWSQVRSILNAPLQVQLERGLSARIPKTGPLANLPLDGIQWWTAIAARGFNPELELCGHSQAWRLCIQEHWHGTCFVDAHRTLLQWPGG